MTHSSETRSSAGHRHHQRVIVAAALLWISLSIAAAAQDENDRALIQRKIDALPRSGGTVTLEARTYLIDGSIILRDNVTLEGAGIDKTILEMAPGAAGSKEEDWHDCKALIKDEKYDEQRYAEGNHGMTVRNLTLDGNADNNPYVGEGIALGNNYDYRIENVHVKNCRGYAGIITWPCHQAARRKTPYRNLILDCLVEGNQFAQDRDATYGHGIYITAPDNENVLLKGCVTRGNAGAGIHGEDRIQYFFVENCQSYDNDGPGIWFCDVARSTIMFCDIHDNGSDGIHMSQGEDNKLNFVYGNRIYANGGHGISIACQYGAAKVFHTIAGNTIMNNGRVNREASGIYLQPSASSNIIQFNQITNVGAEKSQAYGITIDSKNNLVINNYLKGNRVGEAKMVEGNFYQPWDDEKPWSPLNLVGCFAEDAREVAKSLK